MTEAEKKKVIIYFEHQIQSSFLLPVDEIKELLDKLDTHDSFTLKYKNDSGQDLVQKIITDKVVTVMVGPPEETAIRPVRLEVGTRKPGRD